MIEEIAERLEEKAAFYREKSRNAKWWRRTYKAQCDACALTLSNEAEHIRSALSEGGEDNG